MVPDRQKAYSILIGVLLTLLFLLLALDGRMHWDEPGYLYTGAYLSPGEILEGEFQVSGIEGFYNTRIFHVFLVHGVVSLLGPGMHALAAILLFYQALLLLFLRNTGEIVGELLPGFRHRSILLWATAFTPIYLYLSFKTLPEIPALFLVSVATLALVRYLHRQGIARLALSAAALAAAAFCKSAVLLLYLSFVAAALVCGAERWKRGRLLAAVALTGVTALALAGGTAAIIGIDVGEYFSTFRAVAKDKDPLVSTILHTVIEGGLLFAAIPLAFLSRRKREALFLAVWFFAASLPLLLLTSSIEARYLSVNLVPLAGMIALSVEGVADRLGGVRVGSRRRTVAVAIAVLALVAVSNQAMIPIMAHEVRADQIHGTLQELDRSYDGVPYTLLTPWAHTDYHYIRFVYPDRDVRNVHSWDLREGDRFGLAWIHRNEDRFYGERMIRSAADLERLDGPLVYFGFEENFSVHQLRRLAGLTRVEALQKQFDKMNFMNHLELSWMWDDRAFRFVEKARHGFYVAYEVKTGGDD